VVVHRVPCTLPVQRGSCGRSWPVHVPPRPTTLLVGQCAGQTERHVGLDEGGGAADSPHASTTVERIRSPERREQRMPVRRAVPCAIGGHGRARSFGRRPSRRGRSRPFALAGEAPGSRAPRSSGRAVRRMRVSEPLRQAPLPVAERMLFQSVLLTVRLLCTAARPPGVNMPPPVRFPFPSCVVHLCILSKTWRLHHLSAVLQVGRPDAYRRTTAPA
jgi:hypothetical protein